MNYPRFKKGSFSATALKYARDIVTGKIEACWQVRASCQRMIDLFKRDDLKWSQDRVDHICQFAQACPHVIGPLAGETIELQPFQVFILANLFGWTVKATDLRLYREALILLPRGNAKSTLAAIIALYMTFAEGQGGAEGLSGATSLDQANAVYEPAKRMVEMTPALASGLGLETAKRSIYQPHTGSSFKPVIANTKDGGLPWCAITDELHQAKNDVQLGAFRTGMAKRKGADPLLLIISTAGTNLAGVCRQEQLYFESLLSGVLTDDTKFSLIYTIDKADDWRDFSVWRKANPNLGVSIDEDRLKDEHKKAQQSPSYQVQALTKYLNVWCNSATGWLNQKDWADAASPGITIPDGSSVWIGVDLSTKTDLTCISVIARIDGKIVINPYIYLPEGALAKSKNAKGYAEWIASAAINATNGNASDHAEVEDCIRALASRYRVEALACDPWQSAGLMQRLQDAKLTVYEFPQNARTYSPVMDDFEADLLNGNVLHPDNPCLNWMAANISIRWRGIMKSPSRPTGQDHLKIDGIAATLMAYGAYSVAPPPARVPLVLEWFD